MKLFVSALEYSANIHLKYLLCELVKRENIELCGIFDEKILSNSPCGEFLESVMPHPLQCTASASHSLTSHNPKNSSTMLEFVDSNNAKFKAFGKSLCDIEKVAVMGFIDVLKRAKFFLQLRKKCLYLALNSDKVLLMDSSSFNIPLAKKIKKCDLGKEIMYYILPQVWAWKPWRAKEIETHCDKLAAILPFEVECYKQKARFVGHPLLDEIKKFRENTHPLPYSASDGESELDLCDSTLESRSLRGAKKRIQGRSSASADFLLEAEKARHSPKSKKRQLLENTLNIAGGSGDSAALLRKEKSEFKGENSKSYTDSQISNSNNFDLHNLDSSPTAQNGEFGINSPNLITFMPGSRLGEIKRIFPIFLQVKNALKKQDSRLVFNIVIPRKFMSKNLVKIYGNLDDFNISFDAHTSLLQSKFAFICSGTATLECALIGTPFVLGYQGRWVEAFVVKQFLNIPFVGLANILYSHIMQGESFHTELLQEHLNAKNLLDSYYNADPSDFLAKSIMLRNYLKCGSAKVTASWILQNVSDSK